MVKGSVFSDGQWLRFFQHKEISTAGYQAFITAFVSFGTSFYHIDDGSQEDFRRIENVLLNRQPRRKETYLLVEQFVRS